MSLQWLGSVQIRPVDLSLSMAVPTAQVQAASRRRHQTLKLLVAQGQLRITKLRLWKLLDWANKIRGRPQRVKPRRHPIRRLQRH